MRVVTVLGQPSDSVLPTLFTQIVPLGASRYLAGPVSEPGQLAIYRSDGTLERVIGREGGGPTEFSRHISPLIESISGRAIVVDRVNARYMEVDSLGHVSLYGTQPKSLFSGTSLPDGRIVVDGQLHRGDRQGVHIVERGGQVVRSFSSYESGNPPELTRHSVRALAPARNGGIWFSPSDQYEVTLADSLGNISAVLVRPFKSEPPDASGMGRGDWLTSIHEDTNGRVWVVSGHRRKAQAPNARHEQPVSTASLTALAAGLTSTVDVIDPAKRAVIYSETFNAPPFRILGNGLGYRYVEDASGNPRVELMSLQLVRLRQ